MTGSAAPTRLRAPGCAVWAIASPRWTGRCRSRAHRVAGRACTSRSRVSRARGRPRRAGAGGAQTGIPARGPAARWRAKLLRGQPCRGDQPGGHRVGVPHLAELELVASPHGPRGGRDEIEEPPGRARTGGEPAGPADGLAEIRDGATPPAADLVAKQAQPADVAAPDGTRADHATTRLVGVRRRRQLDRVALAVAFDDERRVVEVASSPVLERGVHGLEDTAVEAHAVTTRAQRDPIELHGCCPRLLHRLEHSRAEGRSTSEPAPIASAGSPHALR